MNPPSYFPGFPSIPSIAVKVYARSTAYNGHPDPITARVRAETPGLPPVEATIEGNDVEMVLASDRPWNFTFAAQDHTIVSILDVTPERGRSIGVTLPTSDYRRREQTQWNNTIPNQVLVDGSIPPRGSFQMELRGRVEGARRAPNIETFATVFPFGTTARVTDSGEFTLRFARPHSTWRYYFTPAVAIIEVERLPSSTTEQPQYRWLRSVVAQANANAYTSVGTAPGQPIVLSMNDAVEPRAQDDIVVNFSATGLVTASTVRLDQPVGSLLLASYMEFAPWPQGSVLVSRIPSSSAFRVESTASEVPAWLDGVRTYSRAQFALAPDTRNHSGSVSVISIPTSTTPTEIPSVDALDVSGSDLSDVRFEAQGASLYAGFVINDSSSAKVPGHPLWIGFRSRSVSSAQPFALPSMPSGLTVSLIHRRVDATLTASALLASDERIGTVPGLTIRRDTQIANAGR